jgi:hypothetical protein
MDGLTDSLSLSLSLSPHHSLPSPPSFLPSLGGGGATREAFSGQRTKDLSGVSLIALKTGFGCYCKNNCYYFSFGMYF